MLIGLNGFARAGKDTVGDYLVENYGFEKRSFAAPLKESASRLLMVPVALLDKFKDDEDAFVQVVLPQGTVELSFRQFLQRYGTESHRDVFGQDFWVNVAFAPMDGEGFGGKEYYIKNNVCFTDARFENELVGVMTRGGANIRINRETEGVGNHPSEVAPREGLIDFVIDNNGTFDELYSQVDEAMDWFGVTRQVREETLEGHLLLP